MIRRLMRSLVAIASLLLTAAACTSDATDPQQLAIRHASAAREIRLATAPAVRQQTRAEFAADAQSNADETTAEDYQRQHDTYGRLGFYPRDFDLRGNGGSSSDFYIAYYSIDTKAVTVVGDPDHSTLVHELVHALQDQRFDLSRVRPSRLSSDESLARSALVEGDARMAEYRDLLRDRGQEVENTLNDFVTLAKAYDDAGTIFRTTKLPLIFAAHSAFAYSFGSAFVGDNLGIRQGRWSYAAVDALFVAADGPKSTQAVLRSGQPVDAIEETGLGALPFDVATDWSVEAVDRIGEWYTYVLLYPAPGDKSVLADQLHAWDGDQLLTLRRKDGSTPPSVTSPSAIVWTTIWEDAASAAYFAEQLASLHHLAAKGDRAAGTNPQVSFVDEEDVWLERRDRQVCFVKNLPQAVAEPLAHAALYTEAERRFEVARLTNAPSRLVH